MHLQCSSTGGHPAAACKTGKERVRTTGPLWPKAALPHTPQPRFWFLLFAVVGVVCVGSGAVRQLGPLCNYTFDTVKEVPNHERHSPTVRIFERVPLARVLPLSPESAPGS
jgi:hypothetical protein